MPPLRYRALAHTADMRLMAWGEDERALLANAVAGVLSTALGTRARGAAERWSPVPSWPREPAHRLVATVNEALYHLYVRRAVVVGVRMRGNRAWLGLVDLPAHSRPRAEIKAATFHDLALERRGGRLRAVLTLDL